MEKPFIRIGNKLVSLDVIALVTITDRGLDLMLRVQNGSSGGPRSITVLNPEAEQLLQFLLGNHVALSLPGAQAS